MPYFNTIARNRKISTSCLAVWATLFAFILSAHSLQAQQLTKSADNTSISSPQLKIIADISTGVVNYAFSNGTHIDNAIAYVNDISTGYLASTSLAEHTCTVENISDKIGKGLCLTVKHSDAKHAISITQQFTLYKGKPYALVKVTATSTGKPIETRDISPLAILPAHKGKLFIPGTEPRILDVPFDNDDWTPTVERRWPAAGQPKSKGISYEFVAVYDQLKNSGLVIGSINHDFWKTGLAYQTGTQLGYADSLKVFGGAATADNPSLKSGYGGLDGTHDHADHGTMLDQTVSSPTIYLCASDDLHETFKDYGRVNSIINGKQTWDAPAPVYWNSFGVEGVLGYEKVMMPPAVHQISDFLHKMPNFSAYSKPVLSIDSYDQGIYTTEVLKEIGEYAAKNGQQMGFYFIPFAMWSWKDNIKGNKLPGGNYLLEDVLLHDKDGKPIMYKDGQWGAYAMDPTHPAVRLYIIQQLKKAKAINAKFLKIDFLTAGALETTKRYNPKVRSGMQAYDYGMKTLRHLVDSIMGKDIFITQAISPLFPHQYAHTRFVSTDVYSHLRDDQKGFPGWGSTESSLATGSHMGWMQGTLFPYTNLDVAIMKNFQRNPDLTEQEIKVRLYAMMVMGSILGDGSDYRNPIAAYRAQAFLDNKNIAKFFSDPKAFIPLKTADGDSYDQQLSFYLPGDTTMLALFNFHWKDDFKQTFSRAALHLAAGKKYELRDFMSDKPIGQLGAEKQELTLQASLGDAVLVKFVAVD
jgi:alpha-galactosidase